MAFQLRDFTSIALAMINRAKATQDKITDFNVGSVARTILEAPAIEIEEFYQRMFAGIMEAIPTAIYKGFDFEIISPSAARGLVDIVFAGPTVEEFTIPAGTVFSASKTGGKYLSVQDVTVPVGVTSIAVLVEATQPGAAGNVAVGDIDGSPSYRLPVGASVVGRAITSGSDGETEAERKARFTAFVTTLARGTNGAVEYAARQARVFNTSGVLVEYVSRVGFIEVPGTMDVFIYGAGRPASDALLQAAQKLIDGYWDEEAQRFVPGYRPVGIRVRVMRMVEQAVDGVFTVEMWPGVTLDNAVRNDIMTRIGAVIYSVRAGGVLYVEKIIEAILAAPGVRAARTTMTENILCPSNTVLIPGEINLVAGDV